MATLGQHIHNIGFEQIPHATAGQLVDAYRAFDRSLRGIEYRLAHGAAGHGGTDRAVGNYRRYMATIEGELIERERKDLVGLLVQEARLARRDWQERPELKARLLDIRRTVRAVVREDQL